MPSVRTGLDRLLADGPAVAGLRDGARVALLAHAASIDAGARHASDALAEQGCLSIELLLAPEHGLWGHEQDMERVADARDALHDVPVLSLYGPDRESLRPPPERLAGLDAVVCDVQDVGSRYYTYVYTLSYVMEAAAVAGVPVVVLDRPNPIGGLAVQGPVLDASLRSFVGRFALPVRHGMTPGELALLFRDAFGVGDELRVVELEGWRRAMLWPETGLAWVPPSPNMPTPATALVYPGGCLVEGTTLSEGRGTTTPFELVGAPWLDGRALAERLRERAPAGALFRAASFRPMFHKYAGRPCGGVQVIVGEPGCFRPFETYLVLIAEARALAPGEFAWRSEPYEFETDRAAIDLLLGRPELRERLEAGLGLAELAEGWEAQLAAFAELRARALLYGA